MIRYQVARRYSKALFHFSTSKEELEKRLVDLQEFNKRFDDHPRLMQFLNAPEVSVQEKEEFIKSILDKDFDPLLYKFLFFLLEKKRLKHINEITDEYRKQVHKKLGIIDVRLISAFPLDPSDKKLLIAKLQQSYPNKDFSLIEEIDSKLIGGLIAIIGNRIVDFSISNRLSELKEKLLAAPV